MASQVRRTATESSAATDATESADFDDPPPQYVVGTGNVDASVMVDSSVMVKPGIRTMDRSVMCDNSVMVPAGHTQSAQSGTSSAVHRMMTEVDESMVLGRASTMNGTAPSGRPQNMPRMSVESSASRASTCKTSLDKTVEQIDGPVQFIEINDEGKCRVKAEACEILKMCEGSISVVSVAGLYRTGKSFLLNRLLGLQDGFDIGRSINPCTKGLWIWGRPVELAPDYHCILVDTEGLGSAQRSASHDLQILSLTVLLSSVFIYNSIGAIDEQAIDELHLVLQLASHVHAGSSATGGDKKGGKKKEATQELAPYLPSFFWVLRDFHLNLEDKQGNPVSERGYLESALQAPDSSRPNDDKNRIRKVIRELFVDRDCATLPRPVADEEDLRRVKDLPYEALRPQFREKVEAFCGTVFKSLRQKTMDGQNITGAMFVDLAQAYCKAINNGAIPAIQSAWTSVVKHQMRLALKDAIQVYRREMSEKAMKALPMDEYTLYEIHKAAKESGMEVFADLNIDERNPVVVECRREFNAKTDEIYGQIASENKVAIQQQCVCTVC